jgi:hypothetical protein
LGINENEYQSWQRSGFYSIAYDIGGGVEGLPQGSKIIAYRGTDTLVDVIAWQRETEKLRN